MRSPLFFAHIRAAIGSAVQQTNCHPFRYGRWLFMHNGFIDGFAAIKRDLVLAVDESLYPEIKRLVVSEPIGDLPGAWNEMPEASYGVVGKGDDQLRSFAVQPPSKVL